MLYATTLLVAASALSSFAAAQNTTLPTGISACCTVDANEVPDSEKTSWCQSSQNTCPELCGGQGQIATNGNTCDEDTLQYSCKCSNGTELDLTQYQQSVPGQMCRFWFDQCINATGTDASLQFGCIQARDTDCGNLTTSDEESTTTSASGSLTSRTASATGSDSTAAASGAAAGETTAAAVLAFARDYSTPVFAGGIVALFGLAL